MSELTKERCVVCRTGAPLLTEMELAELRPEIADWQLIEVDSVQRLTRQFKVKNFIIAMNLAHQVGECAEQEAHHPAILVEWGKVTVSWWTHKIQGLHHNDVIMAAKTDEIYRQFAA